MRPRITLAAMIALTGCLPVENDLHQQASNSACGRSETILGQTVLELPPENLGGDLVGMYTLTDVGQGATEYGRYSLLDCRSGAIARVEVYADAGRRGRDVRHWIERLRAEGAMSSPDRFAHAAEQVEGLSAATGRVRREDGNRAACACILHHPEAWASGFPSGPGGLPRVYVEPPVLRVEQ